VLITVLATIGGVVIVGMGGGLIRPMQQRWETWINRFENELPSGGNGARGEAYQRGREDAMRSGTTTEELPAEQASSTASSTASTSAQQAGDWPAGGTGPSTPPGGATAR
jgi:hypothetical protein